MTEATRTNVPRADAGLLSDPMGGPPKGVVARIWYDLFRGLAGFSSAEQSITAAGLLSVGHGLGVKPKRAWAVLLCNTTQFGYAVGEELQPPAFEDAGLDYGVSAYASATHIKAVVGANGIRIKRVDAGNEGQFATITPDNWRIVLRCGAAP